MINHAREFLQTDVIVVGLAVYSLLGLLTDALVRFLERRALAWRSLRHPHRRPRRRRPTSASPGCAAHNRSFGAHQVLRDDRPRHPARRVRRPARPQRLAASPPCCAAWPASTRARRRGRRRRPHVGRLPGAAAAALAPGPRQRRARPAERARAPGARARAERALGGGRPRPRSSTPGRCSSPAARPSGSRWPAPWSASPTCCCSTSRSAPSTR